MAENTVNQNMMQIFSGVTSHGVDHDGDEENFSPAQSVYYQTIVRNPSFALNIYPATPDKGESTTTDEDDFWPDVVGYRFDPTDEELVRYYLMKKFNGEPIPPNENFHETNIYDSDPSQLSQEYKQSNGGKEWYFFSSRYRKHPKGVRPNRETGNGIGFWKVTGVNKAVTLSNGTVIGYKSNLDFYLRQNSKCIRTDWKMHEYQVNKDNSSNSQIQPFGDKLLDRCVLCKIYLSRTTKDGTDKEPGVEDHSSDACYFVQDVNVPLPTPMKKSNRRDYSEMSSMAASNDSNKRARILAPEPSSSFMPTYASYNQNWDAIFSQLPTDVASLKPDSSKQCVDGVSSMEVNNNAMYASQNLFMNGVSPHWIPMAGSYEQLINEAPWIQGNNNTMYASTPECLNLDPMAGSYEQPINEAPWIPGNNNTVYAFTPECPNLDPMAGSYEQPINEAPWIPGNNNTIYVSTPECPNLDPMAGSYEQPINEASWIPGNNNTMYASTSECPKLDPMAGSYEQPINEASWIPGNNNTTYASTPECPNLDPMTGSFEQLINEAPWTPGNNNTMYASTPECPNLDTMAGSYEQPINEAPWIPGNNNTVYASTPECPNLDPMAGSSEQPNNEAPWTPGNNNTMYTSTPECPNLDPMTGSYEV